MQKLYLSFTESEKYIHGNNTFEGKMMDEE
jgi:hypothetical protein